MTNEEARAVLTTFYTTIIFKTEAHFLTNSRPNGIKGMQDVDGRLFMFRKYNDRKTLRFIENYKLPPETDEGFDLVLDGLGKYLKNIYPYAVLESQHMYWKEKRREVLMSNDDIGKYQSATNVEEEFEMEWMKEKIAKANKTFLHLLHVQDKLIFTLLIEGKDRKTIASYLYPDSKYEKTIENKTNYRVRIMEFRYLAWVAAQEIYSDKACVDAFNQYPKQNKRYFGIEKIVSLPSKDLLLKAARNECDESIEIQLPTTFKKESPKPYSKIDFNGKRHDHTVVYQYSDGTLYDHVTRVTKKEAV